jgi:hypothetical protein
MLSIILMEIQLNFSFVYQGQNGRVTPWLEDRMPFIG